jgi:hypothetical protein
MKVSLWGIRPFPALVENALAQQNRCTNIKQWDKLYCKMVARMQAVMMLVD